MKTKRQKQAKTIRGFRKVHRAMGIFLFSFFFIVSISGVLLGWKKHSNEIISPINHQGTTVNFEKWLPLEKLHSISDSIIKKDIAQNISLSLDKIEVKKEKGMIKFVYKQDYWGVQLDGATGQLLNVGKRNADFIENIHDGSIVDNYLGTNGYFKLFYTTLMGIALLTFSISGFWLWYGPKRMRKTN
ncbi:PepSY-associated TM helix domain-containing protein [Urechidicola vernalis]|uniref:PepSY-associated TM helix domain-containing protein n=1 Tax=Urechidicola vernalis TaxID=3075600 RepID=A0ABU2Y3M8_9FLAO|nr:PepSY-associated TM helix domain-containing protein [Urechidicola sp. P050]MDT0552781.1 PepSY-associated TM helix domain-containing protein [Urechidicola sp. P050]